MYLQEVIRTYDEKKINRILTEIIRIYTHIHIYIYICIEREDVVKV